MTKSQLFIIICVLLISGLKTYSQNNTESTELDTAPVAERISITQSGDYVVRVIGETNSVMPSTYIAIRNLYTRDTTIVESNSDGSFSTTLSGLDNMPYLVAYSENSGIPEANSLDGVGTIIYPNLIDEQDISIGLGGWVSYGWIRWFADVSVNQTILKQGDDLSISMEVTFMDVTRLLSATNYDYRIRGQLGLYPIADEANEPLSNEIGVNADGSFEFLSNDLPNLENIVLEISFAETDDISIVNNDLVFTLDFETPLPDEINSGTYMLVFTGMMSVDDGDFELWYESRHFAIDGTNGITLMSTARPHPILVPVVITIDHNETHNANE